MLAAIKFTREISREIFDLLRKYGYRFVYKSNSNLEEYHYEEFCQVYYHKEYSIVLTENKFIGLGSADNNLTLSELKVFLRKRNKYGSISN